MSKAPRILLLTPPFTQLNAPYPATAALAGYLRPLGAIVFQRDLSVETALRILPRLGNPQTTAAALTYLRGRNPGAAHLLARPGFLPLSDRSMESIAPSGSGLSPDESIEASFGMLGVSDRAKLFASLYLDDLAEEYRRNTDPDFGFSRYGASLAESAPDFDAIVERLERRTETDSILEELVRDALAESRPDHVGVTCPFPGTLLGAFRIARAVRRAAPGVKTWLGGGYVSTELRSMEDGRVFDFFDGLVFDEGYAPMAGILGFGPMVRTMTRETAGSVPQSAAEPCVPPFVAPDYKGLDLSLYFSMLEMANPMHRLWSDGKWIKLQLARGCYWRKCAFCDVSLDYIGRFAMPRAGEIADAMERLADETGETGFHFTDEAVPPALARALSKELLRRGRVFSWWGNIRFEEEYAGPLAQLMADAGCIAVTGGLECANDRLLALMRKGITLESARRAMRAFADAGILVHAYLMYAFPTQTLREAVSALSFVRDRFAAGELHSAFFHRFALTVHSPVAAEPEKFGIEIDMPRKRAAKPRFALNEIGYREKSAPDWDAAGRALSLALYNYNIGLGLDVPAEDWFAGIPGARARRRKRVT